MISFSKLGGMSVWSCEASQTVMWKQRRQLQVGMTRGRDLPLGKSWLLSLYYVLYIHHVFTMYWTYSCIMYTYINICVYIYTYIYISMCNDPFCILASFLRGRKSAPQLETVGSHHRRAVGDWETNSAQWGVLHDVARRSQNQMVKVKMAQLIRIKLSQLVKVSWMCKLTHASMAHHSASLCRALTTQEKADIDVQTWWSERILSEIKSWNLM